MPQRAPQPPDEGLDRAHRVRGRIAVPYLVDEYADRDRTPGPQGQHGQQRAQPRTAERDGGAVVVKCLSGAEYPIVHPPIVTRCRTGPAQQEPPRTPGTFSPRHRYGRSARPSP